MLENSTLTLACPAIGIPDPEVWFVIPTGSRVCAVVDLCTCVELSSYLHASDKDHYCNVSCRS